MKRIFKPIKNILYYFDKYWWSDIQESDFYFCDKNGNILIPEDCFAYNPVRHFFMCCRYDLKHWDECDSKNSIFEGKNYDLVKVNQICRKYGVETSYAVQVNVDGKWIQHYDKSAKKDKWYKRNLKRAAKWKKNTDEELLKFEDAIGFEDNCKTFGDFLNMQMKKQNLEKLIPSKAVREQCKKEYRFFDLREQATLVWNNPSLIEKERLSLLEQILEQVREDSKWKELGVQIEERIKIQKELKEKYFSVEDKQYFKISYRDKDSKSLEEERIIFSNVDTAKKYAFTEFAECSLDEEYIITKGYLDSKDEIIAVFNNKDEIKEIYSFSFDSVDICDNTRFENAFVLLPHPFRIGDFVRTIGCEEIGIFRGCRDEEDYQKTQEFYKGLADKGYSDFGDVCCTADYLEPCYDNKNQLCFSHNHPSLINLEFAEIKEDDSNYELLKQAQALVRGKGSLEMFTAEILKN